MIITGAQITVFFLVFARTAGLMQLAPIFSNRDLFPNVRSALAFSFSTLILFVIPMPSQFPTTLFGLILAVIAEFLIGAIMGFTVQILIAGVEFAGTLIDIQAGLSAAAQLDPSSGQSSSIIATFLRHIVIISFVLVDGHHMLLSALFNSFRLLPVATPIQLTGASEFLFLMGSRLFMVGLQIAAPILLVVFMIDFCFGLLSRVAPQVNVFQLGFQVKPIIAMFILLIVVPGLMDILVHILQDSTYELFKLFQVLQAPPVTT